MENLKLNPGLEEGLKELSFVKVNTDPCSADYVFSVEGQRLIKLYIVNEFDDEPGLVYWLGNEIDLGEFNWEFLTVEDAENLITRIVRYKNWLHTLEGMIAELMSKYEIKEVK